MGLKTYLPKLLFIARLLCNYIRKYEDKIRTNLGTDANRAKLDALLLACDALEVVLEAIVPIST